MSTLRVGTVQAENRDLTLTTDSGYKVKISVDGEETGAQVRKNLIINPEGLVNQEGYVDGALTVVGYLYDMWYAGANDGKISRIEKGFEVPSSSSTFGFIHRNDDIENLPDGTILTLSGRFEGADASPIELSGYGIDQDLSNGGWDNGGTFFSFTFTKDTSDIDDQTREYLRIRFNGGDDYRMTHLKLEEGPDATPYETPTITQTELDCYRYYWVSDNYAVSIFGYATGVLGQYFGYVFTYPVTMRIAPTVTEFDIDSSGIAPGALEFQDTTAKSVDLRSEFKTSSSGYYRYRSKLIIDARPGLTGP